MTKEEAASGITSSLGLYIMLKTVGGSRETRVAALKAVIRFAEKLIKLEEADHD